MAAVLNPELYRRLKERFGSVVIANQLQTAKVMMVMRGGKRRPEVGSGGEYYRVCCPMCPTKDSNHHLYISYRYGETHMGGEITNGVICFRCGQNPSDTYLRDMLRPSFAKLRSVGQEDEAVEEDFSVEEVPMPDGTMIPLHHLPATHPASAYLASRGFDCAELSDVYRWSFCYESSHYLLTRRIFIPIFHEDGGRVFLAGYQGRAVPGYSTADRPKYWTLSGFKKSRSLYNLYRARKHKLVVVTEGVADAARVGDSAVALLGKSISAAQTKLLLTHCRHATVAVMLDSDARSISFDIAQKLRRGGFTDEKLAGGAFPVLLPKGDPADYDREWLLQWIAECAPSTVRG